ncbi:MAG: glycoside hydrolase family 25 protein [Flavobacteriales bacterium]|nr:glycoside hydrolase family 25 protein [Flavobacteriales bacterium]
MKKWLIIVLVVLGASTLFYLLLVTGAIRFNYPNKIEYPVRGLDISHHQKEVDWNLLEKEDITFIFMKATEGGDHVDTKFNEYWDEARQRNYYVGAYHFFRFCKTGWEQAENFIKNVPNDTMTLPPVIDLEFGGACKKEVDGYDLQGEIQSFLDRIENHFGKRPIIYSTPEFYKDHLSGRFSEYPIWMRGIISKPDLPDNRDWTFWQYANKGKLKAIEGFVDLNVFNGNKKALEKLIQ